MSAAKLEKNIANLERRLRQEFSSELDAKLELCHGWSTVHRYTTPFQ